MSTKRLATDAMFLTLALVVSYIEVLIPVPVGIPGVKLGLANGVIMVLLFFTTWTRTLEISAQKAIDNTRSVGIGTAPCTIPAVGHPNFQIEDGTMEVGIGHHGEPGINVQPLKTADDIAEEMLDIIIPDLPFESGDEVVVLLSGLGATPVMEQYIVYNRVEEILTEKGIKVHRSYVGNYFTSLEMMGVTLTVMKLDDELKECIDMPANSVGLKQF